MCHFHVRNKSDPGKYQIVSPRTTIYLDENFQHYKYKIVSNIKHILCLE
jgi:hypothetical protein